MSDYKVNLVNDDTPSTSEREEQVLENSGFSTKENDGVYKVNLNEPKDAVQEQSTDEISVSERAETGKEVGEEVRSTEEPTEQKEKVLELIKEDQDAELQQTQEQGQYEAQSQEAELQKEEVVQQIELPENIQKVIDFMKETGGSLEDYVRLNTDYTSVDQQTLLREYYKQTKPHLDNEEISFLIEDSFSFDEEVDDERDIRRKKLAYKEEIAKARNFLTDLKGKYYDEIKLNSRLAPEQKEAVEFYNNYKKQQEELTAVQNKVSEHFVKQTDQVFNNEFKGFDFKVGDNTYRFKVNDVQETKQVQSDILNAFKTFLGEDNMLKDAKGYHKALFAARNADKIANHFYEQGMADAVKKMEAEAKNINMDPRKINQGFVDAGGMKVRAVSGDDSSKLRIKIKN